MPIVLHMDVCMHLTIIFIGHVDAAYRFYKTKCEEDSIKRRGKTAEKQQRKRARERLTRVFLTCVLFCLVHRLFCLKHT